MRFLLLKFIAKAYKRDVANARGITLIELLVAVGLMVLVGSGVAIAILQVLSSQNEIGKKFDASEFVASLARSMNDRASCRTSLTGKVIPANTEFTKFTLTGYKGFGDSASEPLKDGFVLAGTAASPQIVITDLSWRLKENILPASIFNLTFDGKTEGYFKAPMQLRIGIVTYVNGHPTPLPPRYVDYSVLAKASDRSITDCDGHPSVADTCKMIGSEIQSDGTCKISTEGCSIRGSYVRSFCSPSGYTCRAANSAPSRVHPETKDYSCPKGSTPFSSFNHTWVSEEPTGKKSDVDVTNTVQAYMCMSCK